MFKQTVTKRQKSTSQNTTKRNAIYGEEDVTREQPPIELKPSAIKTIELKPSAFLGSLQRELPVALSSWIEGKKPGNIYQIASPQTKIGFNTIAWRDQDGSKLFLQNLSSSGVISESLKVTYPEVARLGEKSHWKNSLPDTIFVNLKSAGSDKSRMAAKQMVLGMLDDYGKSSKLRNKLILKEETKTDNPDHRESVITFSVKGITQIEPIMDTSSLLFNDKRLLVNLQTALSTYQKMLSAGVDNGFRVEEVAATKGAAKRKQASEMFQAIENAALSLQTTVNTEIENQKRTGLTKSDIAILNTLQKQVVLALKDDFKNELDTWRWQKWGRFKPLTEDQIVPGTRTQIGAGAQGPVFKCQLDPVLGKSPVVLKYDGNGLNDEAKGAGIPELNPQQSVRAVAAFKISKQLNLGIIPQTEVFVGTDDNGRPKLGQAMEFVNGTVGQRKAGLKNDAFDDEKSQRIKQLEIDYVSNDAEKKQLAQEELLQLTFFPVDGKYYPKPPIDQKKVQAEIQTAEDIVNNPAKHTRLDFDNAQKTLDKYVEVNGEWYHAKNFPVNIAYGNPVVQKGLSDLQVFDCIIGHADRNPGNWIYEKDNTGSITGVKGIDNDDTFGEQWSPEASKTPGIPPIVDISTALSILKADFNKDIRPLLAGLSSDEKDIAAERFDQVRQEVVQRVRDGNIASIDPIGAQAMLEDLRELTNMPAQPGVLSWGGVGIADTHTEQNSYLGSQLAQKNQEGVVPESGVVLV